MSLPAHLASQQIPWYFTPKTAARRARAAAAPHVREQIARHTLGTLRRQKQREKELRLCSTPNCWILTKRMPKACAAAALVARHG